MPLTAGSRLGTYEITSPLGAGGMGEVFRGRDTKLGRQVAIKVLPDVVEGAPDRVARFEREAKALAALHHPHIATLFGMEQDGGKHFLVMELVEGETLDAHIARGPTPIPEALTIARQIADALEATVRQKDSAQAVVFVEPYPRTGAQFQISKDAEDGHHPVWSGDGRELFYTPGPGSRLIAVPATTQPALAFGESVLIPRFFTNAPPTTDRTYDVSKDGRFLGLRTDVTEAGTPIAPQIEVVTSWFDELRQRVPSR